MRALIQRVEKASVTVDGHSVGAINAGLAVLLGIGQSATLEKALWLADKIAAMRIFPDESDKLNLSLKDVNGEVLVVSQFTLWADTSKGNRPSFSRAARGDEALPFYNAFIERLKSHALKVEQGEFGTIMKVELVNHGPVTIWLEA